MINPFNSKKKSITLITNTQILNIKKTILLAKKIIPYGLSCIQVREKNMKTDYLTDFLLELKLLTGSTCKLILNGPLDLALKTGCDGIHLPENSKNLSLKKITTDNFILGKSFHHLISVKDSWVREFDYAQLGSIFKTRSHPNSSTMNLEEFNLSCNQDKIPIIAVGGISLDTISNLKKYNISGVAIMRELLETNTPEKTMLDIDNKLNKLI
jgi:thiamine-phosphate diphosphorylase